MACTGDLGAPEAFSFRLGGAPYRLTAADVVPGGKTMATRIARHCAKRYLRKPAKAWQYFLKVAPKWSPADLSTFALTDKGVQFFVTLELFTKGDAKPREQRESCQVPYSMLGITPAKLATPRKP